MIYRRWHCCVCIYGLPCSIRLCYITRCCCCNIIYWGRKCLVVLVRWSHSCWKFICWSWPPRWFLYWRLCFSWKLWSFPCWPWLLWWFFCWGWFPSSKWRWRLIRWPWPCSFLGNGSVHVPWWCPWRLKCRLCWKHIFRFLCWIVGRWWMKCLIIFIIRVWFIC